MVPLCVQHNSTFLHLLLCYRLYYLYRGSVSMKEQDIFHYLFWFSPSISGFFTLIQALENAIFFPETPLMVPYSCCAKTPFPMERLDELVTLKVRVALLGRLVVQFPITVKQSA